MKIDNLAKEEKGRATKIKNGEEKIEKIKAELSKDVKVESDDVVNEEMVLYFPFNLPVMLTLTFRGSFGKRGKVSLTVERKWTGRSRTLWNP